MFVLSQVDQIDMLASAQHGGTCNIWWWSL